MVWYNWLKRRIARLRGREGLKLVPFHSMGFGIAVLIVQLRNLQNTPDTDMDRAMTGHTLSKIASIVKEREI